jgi:hypothetical protein
VSSIAFHPACSNNAFALHVYLIRHADYPRRQARGLNPGTWFVPLRPHAFSVRPGGMITDIQGVP